MLRQLLICLVVLTFAAGSVLAHGGIAAGTVKNKSNAEGIPFASVLIEGTNLGVMADSTGRFELKHIPVGKQRLIVSAVGYVTYRHEIDVVDGRTLELSPELERSEIDAGGIVVTGTRTPRYVKESPVFTEVVSKAAIEEKSARNIFEALDGEPGVKVEQQCQGCNFTILRMQGLGADHTQVLLDGQPIYSGLASVYGLQQLSTADVDHIEIVKGAGSALYGSNAVAGAINVVSTVPMKTEGQVDMEFGEAGTNKYSITASSRRDKVGLFLYAQQSEQDELDETGDVNAPGGVYEPDGWIDRVRSSVKNLGFNLYRNDLLGADRLILRGRLLAESRIGGWLTDRQFENPFAEGTERINTDRFSGQAEYRIGLANGSEVNASVAYSNHKRDATNDTFLGDYIEAYGVEPPVHLLRPYLAEEKLLVTNLNLVQPLGNRHRLLVGLQYSHNSLEETGMYLDAETATPYSSLSHKKADEFGAYLQDEAKLSRKLEVVAGLRFDYHSSEDEFHGSGDILAQGLDPLEYDESTVNPRFSVQYSFSDSWKLRGSVGSGFRVPYGFSEDLHLCSGSPRVYKGSNLKPEKSISYSMTAEYTARRATVSINAYRTELTDAIAFVEADEDVSRMGYDYQWENIDDAYVSGIETNGSVSPSEGLVLSGRLELFKGKYDNPREDWLGTPYKEMSRDIPRYPNISGGFKIDYTYNGWSLTTDADIKGSMKIDLTEPEDPADIQIYETESYVLFNARISRTIMNRYKLYAGAKNLGDYTQKVKHISDAAFMYAPVYGRLLYGGIQITL